MPSIKSSRTLRFGVPPVREILPVRRLIGNQVDLPAVYNRMFYEVGHHPDRIDENVKLGVEAEILNAEFVRSHGQGRNDDGDRRDILFDFRKIDVAVTLKQLNDRP